MTSDPTRRYTPVLFIIALVAWLALSLAACGPRRHKAPEAHPQKIEVTTPAVDPSTPQVEEPQAQPQPAAAEPVARPARKVARRARKAVRKPVARPAPRPVARPARPVVRKSAPRRPEAPKPAPYCNGGWEWTGWDWQHNGCRDNRGQR